MDLIVTLAGGVPRARFGNRDFRCAIGRGGLGDIKYEGDGVTPLGRWPLRQLFYRPDRLARPATALPVTALSPEMGWCDAPADPRYNLPVTLPYPASAESLWREDGVYDLIVPLGYNDAPIRPGLGSAIFLHLARPNFEPTEGCVAVRQADLLDYLALATPESAVVVRA